MVGTHLRLVVAAALAFSPQLSLAQAPPQPTEIPGASCSPHPAEALNCAYSNGTVVGDICFDPGYGVFCCTDPNDCIEVSSSSSGAVSSSTSSAAAPQDTEIYQMAGPSCFLRDASYSPQCVPDSYINGTLDPSLQQGLSACFTKTGTYCCKVYSDCTYPPGHGSGGPLSSSGMVMSIKPTGSTKPTSGVQPTGSAQPTGSIKSSGGSTSCATASSNPPVAGPSKATSSSDIPKFTNAAAAGNGVAAAAVAGAFGAAVAFI